MGGAIVFDYRTVHRGTANAGVDDRPMLYLTYGRPWFNDNVNFPKRSLFDEASTADVHNSEHECRVPGHTQD